MKKSVDLSIIIVSFNTKELVQCCMEALERAQKESHASWEVIVVDNASTDGTHEYLSGLKGLKGFYRNVIVIENARNLGFSRANNIGIKQSHGAYVLLLNSDTEISIDAVPAMLRFMDGHPKAGAATCRLILPDGSIDPACHRGFPTPWASLTYFVGLEHLFPKIALFSRYHLWFKDMRIQHQIDCPSGAFFFTRRQVLESVGVLDEDYFMYGEDVDWAYRIKQAGWEIWYTPEATVLHKKKQSGRAHADAGLRQNTQRYFYETMLLFYKKHYRSRYPSLLYFLIKGVIRVRVFLAAIFS